MLFSCRKKCSFSIWFLPRCNFKKVKLYSIYGQVIDVYNVSIVLIGYVRPEWVTVTKWNYYFWFGAALTSTVHEIGLQTFRHVLCTSMARDRLQIRAEEQF